MGRAGGPPHERRATEVAGACVQGMRAQPGAVLVGTGNGRSLTVRAVTGRSLLLVAAVVLLAACGQAPAGDQRGNDPNATVEQPVPGPTTKPTKPTDSTTTVGTAAGVVVDTAGQPVAGAMVVPRSLDIPAVAVPELAVLTDQQGRYVWHLRPGRYELIARSGDQVSAPVQVEVTDAGTTEANLTFG